MPKKNHTNLKIIAATSMTIFSLACVFVSTIAWFAANRTVNGNGNGFEIGNESGLIKSVSLHELQSGATSYQFNQKAAVTYTASGGGFRKDPEDFPSLSIGTYDSLVDQVYAVLYVIEIDKSAMSGNSVTLQITTSTEEKDNLFYQDASGTYVNLLKKEGNPMSSIVQFAFSSFSNPVYRFGGTSAPSPSFKTFKTATGYSTSIPQQFIDGSGTSSFSYLELIVAYNNQTIEDLLDINETNETIWSLDYNTIKFTQDWRISVI